MTATASTTRRRRDRLTKICVALPEVTVRDGPHLAYMVRGKIFGYHLDDHHGDGRVSVLTKAGPGENDELVASDPERFFIPAYIGHRGWVGLYLDLAEPDWTEVAELVHDSYRLIGPKRLVALLG
jgi:phosphoribosylglycinamide formyltransferase-1